MQVDPREVELSTACTPFEQNHPDSRSEDYSNCDQEKSSPPKTEDFEPQTQIFDSEVLKSDEDKETPLDN